MLNEIGKKKDIVSPHNNYDNVIFCIHYAKVEVKILTPNGRAQSNASVQYLSATILAYCTQNVT